MILNIRGPNGAGKSWIVFRLIEHFAAPEILNERGKIVGYQLQPGLRVFGRYNVATGGVDRFASKGAWDGIMAEIRRWHTESDLILEGMVASSIYGRWAALSEELGEGFIWAFLDTPYEECCRRLLLRNGGKAFNRAAVAAKIRGQQRQREKALAAGYRVVALDHQRAFLQTLELLGV